MLYYIVVFAGAATVAGWIMRLLAVLEKRRG